VGVGVGVGGGGRRPLADVGSIQTKNSPAVNIEKVVLNIGVYTHVLGVQGKILRVEQTAKQSAKGYEPVTIRWSFFPLKVIMLIVGLIELVNAHHVKNNRPAKLSQPSE